MMSHATLDVSAKTTSPLKSTEQMGPKRAPAGPYITPSRHSDEHSNKDSTGDNAVAPVYCVRSSQSSQSTTGVVDLRHKKIKWYQAVFVLVAETISLGILSLPAAVASLGIVVGALMIAFFSIATTTSGFLIYYFKMKYWGVKGYSDAARVICGNSIWAAAIVELLFMLLLVFIMAGHVLTFATEANTIAGENHWRCTVVFKVMALFICMLPTLFRTLKAQQYLCFTSCCSIVAAVLIAIIGIAIQNPAGDEYNALPPSRTTDFADWSLAVSNIMVSFTGTLAYFRAIDEMEEPRDFPKALLTTNFIILAMYMCTGVVIYRYAGANVASPALGSAGPMISKIAYGVATPTIIVAGVITAYIAAKNIDIFYWRDVKHRPEVIFDKGWTGRTSWIIIVVALWLFAFVLANVLPYFSPLLGLIGAISGTFICLGFPAWYTLVHIRDYLRAREQGLSSILAEKDSREDGDYLSVLDVPESGAWWKCFKYPQGASGKLVALWALCWFYVVLAWFLTGIGMYGSLVTIIRDSGDGFSPFSCAVGS